MHINLTKEAVDVIAKAAKYPFTQDGVQPLRNGTFRCQLRPETFERLVTAKLKGESYSDTIVRIFTIHAREKGERSLGVAGRARAELNEFRKSLPRL